MSGFTLDQPEQINLWVLLSRRHQVQLHLKGLKVPGIVKACREQIPGCENARRARDCIVPIEETIAAAGGEVDYNLVNVHVMFNRGGRGTYWDCGIFSSMSEVEANPGFVREYQAGLLELVLTLDEPREPNGQGYVLS